MDHLEERRTTPSWAAMEEALVRPLTLLRPDLGTQVVRGAGDEAVPRRSWPVCWEYSPQTVSLRDRGLSLSSLHSPSSHIGHNVNNHHHKVHTNFPHHMTLD